MDVPSSASHDPLRSDPSVRATTGRPEEWEERYRALLEQTSDGVFVCGGWDRRMLWVNDAACRITGYSRETLLAMRLDDLLDPQQSQASHGMPTEAPGPAQSAAPRAERMLCGKGGRPITVLLNVRRLGEDTEQVVVQDLTEFRVVTDTLRASEAEMRALFGAMTDLTFVFDRNGTYEKVGPTSPDLLYRPAEFILGRSLHEVFPQELADEMLAALRQALDEQRTVTIEYELPIHDTQRWFSAALSPMDADHIVWVARDVTGRHEAERAVQQSEERYRLLFEGNPIPLILFDERTFAILEVNDAAVIQYGWSREELTRMTVGQIRPPEQLDAFRLAYATPPDGRRVPGRHWHWRKDGTVFPVDVAVHRLTIGGHVARLAMAQDVTERARVERERQDAYSTLAGLVDRSPLAIIALDAEFHVSMWNPAAERMFGYRREEVLGRLAPHLPEDRSGEHALLYGALAQGRKGVTNFETRRRRKDGSLVDVMLSTATIMGTDGRPSFIGFLSDISERRVLEEELRQAQKMEAVGRLAGGIAHDFNNILTAIVNYSELLLQQPQLDASVRLDVEEILEAGQRAARLTRQLLAFSRRQILQPQLIDIGEVVDRMQAMLRRVIGEDVQLETMREEAGRLVRADPGQMEQVILNLAVNARDAMPTGGTLRFVVESRRVSPHEAELHPGAIPGDYVVLSATDTGHGMAPDSVCHIFEPFFTTKEVGKGTGLGLATVYGVVQQSGGFLTVESAVGVGTTFRVLLPEWTGDAELGGQELPAPVATDGRETILLAEDDAAVRGVARRVLEQHGYRLLEAANGREALELLAQSGGSVDLVLTDYIMPELGGRALVERLHALGLAPAVLYMSGYADDAVLQRGDLPAGMGFVQKPFTGEQLIARVRQALQVHRTREER